MSQPSNGARATARIRFQKATVEKLKRELYLVDPRTRSHYVKRFLREFRRAERACALQEVLDEAAGADVIYLADYHALPATQAFAVRFVNQLLERRGRARELALCLEAFYARHQRLLEAYLTEQLGEPEFLHRIRYEAEWGYEWGGYRSLLELARQRGLAVFGIDCEPRQDLRLIARRDRAAAEQIVSLTRARPGVQLIVLFGESHLAADHLPGKVQRRAAASGLELRQVVIAQNVDALYWKLVEGGQDRTAAVRVTHNKYCVFTATPLEKYQAYARVIERWQAADDGDEGEHAAAFYHILEALCAFLKINKYRHRLKRGTGQLLVEVWPEIYDDRDFAAFAALLRCHGAGAEEISALRRRAQAVGCAYAPRINAIFVESFASVSASEEAARYLAAALRGELWEQARAAYPSALDRFAAGALDEALAFFASKLLAPQRAAPLLLAPEVAEQHREAWSLAAGVGHACLEMLSRFFVDHEPVLNEALDAARVPVWFEEIAESDGALLEVATRYVGRALGEGLYQAYGHNLVTSAEIKRLFAADFAAPGSATRCYRDWVRKLRRAAVLDFELQVPGDLS
jgi:hypothetical protein